MTDGQWQNLGEGIYCVDADYIQPRFACCYLVVQGNQVAVVDTGTSQTVETIAALLEELGLDETAVRYIVPTHIHLDHAGGVGGLMQRYPQARLVVHPRGARHMVDPEKLVAGAVAVYGEDRFRRLYGDILPVEKGRVIAAEDGFTLDLNGRQFEIRDTPGHADHHFCVWDRLSKGWFSGDTFGISYGELAMPQGRFIFPSTTPVQFHADKLLASIDLLMSYQPQRIYLAHYGMVENPGVLALQLKEQVLAYRDLALGFHQSESPGQALEEALAELMLKRIKAIQPDCDTVALSRLLAMDVNLNAQGLAVWLKRRKES